MFNTLKNNRGSSLLGAVVVMVVLAAAATTVVNISGTDTSSSANHSDSVKALAYGNGGIQWALDKLSKGDDPAVTNKTFDGKGSFDVTTDPAAGTITVTATVGNAVKTQTINANFAGSCVDDVLSTAIKQDNQVFNMSLDKGCNEVAILTKVTVSWDWSACAVGIGCEADQSGIGEPPNGKFWICHVPPGNPENAHTLSVNEAGWRNGHNNGEGEHHNQDYIGPCEADLPVVTSCTASGDQLVDLAACEDETLDATVQQIDVNGTSIFKVGEIPAATTAAASAGQEIDVSNFNLTDNDNNYLVDATFSAEPVSGGWYTVRFDFSDGSHLESTFRAGDVPDASAALGEGFEVTNGVVTVETNYLVDLDVIGSSITCGVGGAEINVSVELCKDNVCSALYSGADVDGGESYETTTTTESDYVIRATASLASCNNFSRTYNSTNLSQVQTLVNGDAPPAMVGFGDQQSVAEFLEPYLDEAGLVSIEANQVIYLFELGTNMNEGDTTGADFQDLVVIMSLSQVQ
ncbi:MAG: hypothetical protein HQM16_02455 [Deltaproteobacteria bacterium]|nr:hypothetical protein [Deltaproteobacteria bacterium]